MSDPLSFLMTGTDNRKEIIQLWYEITFLRLCLNRILHFNPTLRHGLTQEAFDKIRKEALDIVSERFPDFKQSSNEAQPESPSCIFPKPLKSPSVSHLVKNVE